jgi:hypothetical protein
LSHEEVEPVHRNGTRSLDAGVRHCCQRGALAKSSYPSAPIGFHGRHRGPDSLSASGADLALPSYLLSEADSRVIFSTGRLRELGSLFCSFYGGLIASPDVYVFHGQLPRKLSKGSRHIRESGMEREFLVAGNSLTFQGLLGLGPIHHRAQQPG